MKPDPIKVQALQDLPTPQNQKQLESFLGLINYLQPFLPDIAAKTTFLREHNGPYVCQFQKMVHI